MRVCIINFSLLGAQKTKRNENLSSDIVTYFLAMNLKQWLFVFQVPVGILAGHLDGLTYIDPRGDGRYLITNSKDQVFCRQLFTKLDRFRYKKKYLA